MRNPPPNKQLNSSQDELQIPREEVKQEHFKASKKANQFKGEKQLRAPFPGVSKGSKWAQYIKKPRNNRDSYGRLDSVVQR